MMLDVVVAKVGDDRLPVDEELAMACEILYTIKVHVNHPQSFLLDGVVGEAVGGGVVNLDCSGRLWVP